jgi:hypothetical protein
MKNVNFDIVEPLISDVFKKQSLPPKPIIAIHSRDQRESLNLIKTFYIKFPQYRWVTFRDMRGLSESEFAKGFQDVFLSVWIDDDSSFGTFPIESIKSNVPVIGKVPNIIPEWMNDDNGIWVYDENQIPDLVFNYIKNWMEDSLPDNLLKVADTLKDKYTIEIFEKATVEMYNDLFEKKLTKLNTIKENLEKTLEKNEN